MNKVLILCDSMAVWYLPIKQHSSKVDFEKLYAKIMDGRKGSAVLYVTLDPCKDSSFFLERLSKMPWEVRTKVSYESDTSPKSVSWIREMEVEAKDRVDEFDTLVLVSGSRRFCDLAEEMHDLGKKVESWCFSDDLDGELSASVDVIEFLDSSVLM